MFRSHEVSLLILLNPTAEQHSIIRRASYDDIDWILPQLKEFSRFYGTKKELFSTDDYSREGMEAIIKHHVCFIAERKDVGRVGLIAGFVMPHVFNPNVTVLSEVFWWVDPLYRGSRAALLLLNEFVAWGKKNAQWVTFSLTEKSPVDDSVLTRRGFHLHERSFLMEVN